MTYLMNMKYLKKKNHCFQSSEIKMATLYVLGLALFGNPPKPINNGFYTLRQEKRKAMDGWLWHRMQHCVQCKNRVPFIL